MIEVGDTDGSTTVRVHRIESVLRPTVRQTTGEDLALLTKATVERVSAQVTGDALEQMDTFAGAMAAADEAPLVLVDEDGSPATQETSAFVQSFPADVRDSRHLVEVLEAAQVSRLAIGNATRDVIVRNVRAREQARPT
jgi:hypothetical protein